MDAYWFRWALGLSEMIKDAHPFPCSNCKLVTPHIELKRFNTEDVSEAPEEVWLVECQRCFLQRIIYPSDRVASKEDDIVRCEQCGGWKMKSGKCRVCRLAAGFEQISVKYWTGNSTMERPYDEQAPLY
jgi:hypothetical protein